jgi:hypothetical protein
MYKAINNEHTSKKRKWNHDHDTFTEKLSEYKNAQSVFQYGIEVQQLQLINKLHQKGILDEFIELIVLRVTKAYNIMYVVSELLLLYNYSVDIQQRIFYLCFKHHNIRMVTCMLTPTLSHPEVYKPTNDDLMKTAKTLFIKNNASLLEVLLSFYPKDFLYSIKALLLRNATKYEATSCISIIKSI